MVGDRAKSENSFSRWVNYFGDGRFAVTIKGNERIPSPCSKGKRYNRRFLRRTFKQSVVEI